MATATWARQATRFNRYYGGGGGDDDTTDGGGDMFSSR